LCPMFGGNPKGPPKGYGVYGKGKGGFLAPAKGVRAFGSPFGGKGKKGHFVPKGGFGGKGLASGSGLPYHKDKPANPVDAEKNRQILDALLPCVSAKIDENGGVMRVADLCDLKEVKDHIAKIPNNFPKTLPKILSLWSDFFVNMSDGLVGTSMGYDTGMIRQDGTLDPSFESLFATAHGKTVHEEHSNVVDSVPKPHKKVDLAEAADQLWRAALNLENDTDLYKSFEKVQIAQAQERGETPLIQPQLEQKKPKKEVKMEIDDGTADDTSNMNLQDAERINRRKQILHRIFEKLRVAPGKQLFLCAIVQDPLIRDLKKGAVSKFLHWLQEFPNNFDVMQIDGGSQYRITLLSEQMPRLTPVKRQRPK